MIRSFQMRPLAAFCALLGFAMLTETASLAQTAEAEAQRAPERFPIYAIDVSGVTRLQNREIEAIIYRFTGPEKSAEDVEGARKAIQDAYAAKGYEAVVVEIPAQPTEQFQQGIVQIAVSEAPVGRVRVIDSKYHALSVVREQVPSLKEGEPLDLKTLQGDLAAANRFPDRQVTPSFKPGQVPGTLDVDLRVDSRFPLHSTLEFNNDNSPSTTRPRVLGSVRYTNLWEAGHTISASFVLAPRRTNDSRVISGSYLAPLIGSPWSVLLYGYKSNSNIASLGGTNVLGDGYQIGLRAIYRLPSTGTVQSISFGPDYKDFKQDIFVSGINVGRAPIRYLPFVTEYTIAGGDDALSFDANLGATVGLRAFKRTLCIEVQAGLPCLQSDQFRNRAANSVENFFRLNGGFNLSYATKSDVVAALSFSGQLGDSPLVTNEQFAIGGLGSVRSFLQSEAVGDDGYVTALELRAPSFASFLGEYIDEFRFFGFVDGGFARVREALPGQQERFYLLGAGGGARLRLFDMISSEIVIGVPLRDGPVSEKGDTRIVFTAKGEF